MANLIPPSGRGEFNPDGQLAAAVRLNRGHPEEPPGRGLWREAGAYAEYRCLVEDPIYYGVGLADPQGQAVMVIPGFLSPDSLMRVMGSWLARTGHRPIRAGIGRNVGCAEETTRALETRLEQFAERQEQRIALVAHSRGGHFARVLGVRRPDLISGIVTLGTPPLDHHAIHPLIRLPPVALAVLGSLGVPGLFRLSCFLGECCRRFRVELEGPFPADVGFVAVSSRADNIVDARLLNESAAQTIDVRASHLGIVANRHAYRAVAGALAEFRAQDWDR